MADPFRTISNAMGEANASAGKPKPTTIVKGPVAKNDGTRSKDPAIQAEIQRRMAAQAAAAKKKR